MRFQLQDNFDISIATDGKEALSHLAIYTPDLIVLDLMLPDTTGFILCSKIRKVKRLKTKPIIILSSLGRTNDVEDALAVGADDFVHKPYVVNELITKIVLALLSEAGIYKPGMIRCNNCKHLLLKATRVCRYCGEALLEEEKEFADVGERLSYKELQTERQSALLTMGKPIKKKIIDVVKKNQLSSDLFEYEDIKSLQEIICASKNESLKLILQTLSADEQIEKNLFELANLPFLIPRISFNSLKDVIAEYGIDNLKILFVSIMTYRNFFLSINNLGLPLRRRKPFKLVRNYFNKVWAHALACAVINRRFAMETGWPIFEAFTAGLMHDISYIIIPRLVISLTHSSEHYLDPIVLSNISTEIHTVIGHIAMENWGFPNSLKEVNKLHHKNDREEVDITKGVMFADWIAMKAELGVEELEIPNDYQEIIANTLNISSGLVEDLHHDASTNVKIFEGFITKLTPRADKDNIAEESDKDQPFFRR